MHKQTSIVVTSISAPNGVLRSLATGSRENGISFYVIGDVRSPADFSLDGCDFYSLDRQAGTGFRFAEACPTRHYARKNIGYLIAIREGARTLIETDDDNYPLPTFWAQRTFVRNAPLLREEGGVNVYSYFS